MRPWQWCLTATVSIFEYWIFKIKFSLEFFTSNIRRTTTILPKFKCKFVLWFICVCITILNTVDHMTACMKLEPKWNILQSTECVSFSLIKFLPSDFDFMFIFKTDSWLVSVCVCITVNGYAANNGVDKKNCDK